MKTIIIGYVFLQAIALTIFNFENDSVQVKEPPIKLQQHVLDGKTNHLSQLQCEGEQKMKLIKDKIKKKHKK